MKAAVLTDPRRFRVEEAELLDPGPSEVRVRIEGCGVCASNVTPWEGPDWMRFPSEVGGLGHEGWGVIDAAGSEVQGLAIGDRVATLSQHSYAEFDIADASVVVPLPAELDGRPFPGEPLGCAMNILARSGIEPGQTVAIVGVGFLGAVLTRLAANVGARVIAISRRACARETARRMGAAETIAMDDHWRIIETVRELTSGAFCERVIEAVGKQWPLDLAAELTRERGRLVIAGYHQDGPRQVNMQLWNWRGLDVVNAHERVPAIYADGVRAAVTAVVSGEIDPSPLITHTYPLTRLDEALAATRDRPDGFMKAIVVP
jgi:threonine dehydrogenase-like Zn-dependent dehydrogenase